VALGELVNLASADSTEKFFLVTTPNITSLTKAISSNLLVYLTPAFTVGAIYEFCKGGRFFDLLLKLVLACAVISSGQKLIEYGCHEGFRISDQIASWASGGSGSGNWLPRFILNSSSKNELLKLKQKELKNLKLFSKSSSIPSVSYMISKGKQVSGVGYSAYEMDIDSDTQKEISNIESLEKNGIPDFGVSDTLMIAVLLGACMIVKLTFTAGYYLSIALLVVPCLLLFIPTLESSFAGLLKTMFFCFLLPIVFTILLFLLGEMIQDNFFDPRIIAIEKTVMLIVMSVLVVMSIFITWTLLTASGIASALSGAGAMMGSQLIRQTVGTAMGGGLSLLSTATSSLVKNPLVVGAIEKSLGSISNSRPNSLVGKLAQRGVNSAKNHLEKYEPKKDTIKDLKETMKFKNLEMQDLRKDFSKLHNQLLGSESPGRQKELTNTKDPSHLQENHPQSIKKNNDFDVENINRPLNQEKKSMPPSEQHELKSAQELKKHRSIITRMPKSISEIKNENKQSIKKPIKR